MSRAADTAAAVDVEDVDYVESSGPGIVDLPDTPPDAEAAGAEDVALEPRQQWEQETIEQLLRGTGVGVHALAGAGERDWLMTEEDLARIAPPLTRICNRYEPSLRAAPLADPILVAHGLGLYGWRSALERQRALRDAQEAPGARWEPEEPPTATEEPQSPPEQPDAPQAAYFPDSPKARQA